MQPDSAELSRDYILPQQKHCFRFKLRDVFVLTMFYFENVALFSNSVLDIVPIYIMSNLLFIYVKKI
jgi:hypothetical protein